MKTRFLALAGLAGSISSGWMSPLLADEAPHPTLVVALSVDQFSSDLFSEYRALYKGGLARLAGGVVFPRGHQSHASTETCPGHSTILTGARPARTGIIANEWYDPNAADGRGTASIYCVEKIEAGEKIITPDFLLVPTLGDRMKARDANTRVVAVAGKDRSAIMMGGHEADLTLWWSSTGFKTYAGKESNIPKEIAGKVNDDVRSSYARSYVPKLPPICAAKSRKVELTSTISVGTLQATKPNTRQWRATPAMDALTVDAALAAMKANNLGKRNAIDLLAVSLAGNDYVGHYYGTEGAEMCAQQLALDHTLGRLFSALDKAGISYVVALTADHGGLDIPERNRARGVPTAERIDPELYTSNMSATLAEDLKLESPVLLGSMEFANDVYLSASIPADRRAAALALAYQKYSDHRQVERVFTRNELIAAHPPTLPVDEWTLLDRAKASFNPQRSGDLIVLLKPYVTLYQSPKNAETDYIASHGSPWGYDRRVPIMFWWRGITGFDQPGAVETVDIAPTLAALIGLEIPADEIDGRALPIIAR
jgi:predicted AlkP superfamily pyrophosphatase or phosphodiesterase